jgi:transposase
MTRDELRQLDKEELIDIILRQQEMIEQQARTIERLEARVADLEAKLNEPPKTPRNSSKPPSQGQKANRPPRKGKKGKGGTGKARDLHPDPDRVVEARAESCPDCGHAVDVSDQTLKAVYDRIEIPPVKPDVTRVHQYQTDCPCCGTHVDGIPPEGLEPGSPFGKSVQALVIYLHTLHAISYERMGVVLADLFGLEISEGAIANMFARTNGAFSDEVAAITDDLRQAEVVASDETGARVQGRTWWQWLFCSTSAVVHHIAPSRGKAVVREVLGAHIPAVWVSDRFSAQKGHGADWQVCLAHLLRDVQYALEAGDRVIAPPIKRILLRAVAIGRRREDLRDTTLRQYRYALDRRLDQALRQAPDTRAGETLYRQIVGARANLFVFVTNRAVPSTNNISERYLRPAVIFRKVTNGFRADWGARFYAAVRSVVDTGRLHGHSALSAIRTVLNGGSVLPPAPASSPRRVG